MGILYLVSTPIGNLEDISLRAVAVLSSADLILCEDTRRTGRLLQWLRDKKEFSNPGLEETEMNSYTDYTRERRMDEVLARLAKGQKIALVSDAGTPLLSDPGYKLVQKVIELSNDFEVKVETIPGANAILPALQLSGLPPDKFMFLGFLPRTSKHRKELLRSIARSVGKKEIETECHSELDSESDISARQIPDLVRNDESLFLPIKTAICFESPFRLQESLHDLKSVFGDTRVAVCRELTKMHEEIFRGTVSEALDHFEKNDVKGELTVVFSLEDF